MNTGAMCGEQCAVAISGLDLCSNWHIRPSSADNSHFTCCWPAPLHDAATLSWKTLEPATCAFKVSKPSSVETGPAEARAAKPRAWIARCIAAEGREQKWTGQLEKINSLSQ